MNDNTNSNRHAPAPMHDDQPETLRSAITSTAVMVGCVFIRIVLWLVAVATVPVSFYYFFESIGAHRAANVVANSVIFGLVVGLVVSLCALPILVFARIVAMFQDGDRS